MHTRLFLLRHGRSLANEQGLIASRPENAGEALGLTQHGKTQVRQGIEHGVASGDLAPPFRLVSSPLLRARESADVAAEILGVRPTLDSRLSERDFGDLELDTEQRYEAVWTADRRDANHRSWGVESVADVLQRAGPVVAELGGDQPFASVILCTHGDVASTLLCASLGGRLEEHREVGALETGQLHELGTPIG